MTKPHDFSTIDRWKAARRATLSAIFLAGAMATTAAIGQRMTSDCQSQRAERTTRDYVYSGVGIELDRRGDHYIVERVLPGTPADGQLFPGAIMVSVDGEQPVTMEGWSSRIRGVAGSEVELDVAYPESGHQRVSLTRAQIRLRY